MLLLPQHAPPVHGVPKSLSSSKTWEALLLEKTEIKFGEGLYSRADEYSPMDYYML